MNEKVLRDAARLYQDDILPPYDSMMEMDGFDAICEFSRTFSGTSVYVPSLRTIFGQCLEKDMLHYWNGANVRELVRRYGFSERHIRDMLRRHR